MKTLSKFILLALVLVIALPILAYRTGSPCEMLKKEWVERAQEKAEEVVEQGREAASDYGEQIERIAEQVGEIVENVTEDIAEGVAEMRVEEMSTGQCVKELLRIKTGREPTEGW
jgi:hypothetical protein